MADEQSTPREPAETVSPDTAIWSFTDRGPWVVTEESLVWRRELDALRAASREQALRLAAPPRMPPSLRVLHIASRLALAAGAWSVTDRRRGPAASRSGISRRLRRTFEGLGPTYIKLGQILSSGEGIFPPELVGEFRQCRDEVSPEPFHAVRSVIEEDLRCPLEEVFSRLDPEPLAAASIAQVHAATLRSGEEVVVKVQRPRVDRLVREDLRAMAWIAPRLVGRIPVAALANPPALVELFADTIVEELDFRLEADNMLAIGRVLADTGQRSIVVPRPHPTLVTRRVLVMERLSGFSLDDVEGLRGAGVDTKAIIRAGMISTLEGAMLYGVFHGDLHAGNIFVDADGQVSLLDFGITGRLDDSRRIAFVRLLMGGITNDVRTQLKALQQLGAVPLDTDLDALIADLGLDRPMTDPSTLSAEELIGEIRELVKTLAGSGARMPKELMLFVKNLLFLDGAIATLAPDLDILSETFNVASYFATRHGDKLAGEIGVEPGSVAIDLDGFKGSLGLDRAVESFTHAQLQERRAVIRSRLEARRAGRRRRRGLLSR